jgi:SAM-dependent methyltransferase
MTSLRCRLCAATSIVGTLLRDGSAWCECRSCGLTFIIPRDGQRDPVRVYSQAHAGLVQEAGMRDFFVKMAMRSDADAAGVPARKILNSAHLAAVAILREFPPGCAVFDIGCGGGHFLRTIRDLHYTPFGLDVAQPVVQMLRAEGFPVWHGTIDTVPRGWVDPQVCTSFFMIHHLADPVGFIRTVRRMYPRSLLIIAAHNDLDRPKAEITDRALPPRTYSWWGQKQLVLALQQGGYRPVVQPLKAQPREGGLAAAMSVYSSLSHRTPALARRLLAIYYDTLPVWGWPKALWMRCRRFSKFLLVVGYPTGEAVRQDVQGNGSALDDPRLAPESSA